MQPIDYSRPSSERRVVLTYKNFPVAHHVSHIGLGVSALNTAKVLRANGVYADVWPILGAKDLAERIVRTTPQPSHVVIGAPWIPTLDLQAYLVFRFPHIMFTVCCHSNVSFLSADPQAIRNFREDLDLEMGALNFTASANSTRLCQFIKKGYGRPCTHLPNLYFLETTQGVQRRLWSGGTIRMGSFGAVRPLKNHTSACAAAIMIAEHFHTDAEFHISVGRIEGGYVVVRAITELLKNSPRVKLVQDEWYQWPRFRAVTASMHLLLQPSFTETFNMVTADGASESIPSVTSKAIEWTPEDWQAEVDEPENIARVGERLLQDYSAGVDGFNALVEYNAKGIREWMKWLKVEV